MKAAAAIAAPFVIFGLLYLLVVSPARQAASTMRQTSLAMQRDLQTVQRTPPTIAETLRALAADPAVGATDISIQAGLPSGAPDSYTPITVAFDAPVDR